jgi:catechol 2,3-dioxygenase-like lactoylglutathione lyase family enzyme
VGIAVRDMDEALKRFREAFGAVENTPRTVVPGGEFAWADFWVGGAKLEVVQPLREGSVQEFLDRRGEGIIHLSMEVHDLRAAIEFLESRGLRVVDPNLDQPGGFNFAYVSPKSLYGTAVQLFELGESKS